MNKNDRKTQHATLGGTVKTPYTEPEYKIPGFTGHVHGILETYKKTPIPCQIETAEPHEDSFIHTRTALQYVTTRRETVRDPCNNEENFKKPKPGNVWPNLQDRATQDSYRPPVSNIALGDSRINPFKTSYNYDFRSPFDKHARIRSPNRNHDIAQTTASLTGIYKSAYDRVSGKRLQKMISTMRERMDAKCGNSNDNAFRIRKLFLAWDKQSTGMVHLEDLRQMCESFGMQLDDDSILALFYVYDPEGTGYLAYMDLVQHLMHPDTFRYYIGSVDNSQQAVDADKRAVIVQSVSKKFTPVVSELGAVMKAFDEAGTGFMTEKALLQCCASVGVVVSQSELAALLPLLKTDVAGDIDYMQMCGIFSN